MAVGRVSGQRLQATLGRELRAMRYRKLSARPRHHGQAEGAIEAFKKIFPRRWQTSLASMASIAEVEVWFGDEARLGQKNKITRRWADAARGPLLPGTSAPHRPIFSVPSVQRREKPSG